MMINATVLKRWALALLCFYSCGISAMGWLIPMISVLYLAAFRLSMITDGVMMSVVLMSMLVSSLRGFEWAKNDHCFKSRHMTVRKFAMGTLGAALFGASHYIFYLLVSRYYLEHWWPLLVGIPAWIGADYYMDNF